MKPPLRVIDTGLGSGRWNTALSFGLLSAHARESSADILRFYRFEHCILLGASQAAQSGLDPEGGQRDRFEIARRITGGGSVYMEPGMLAWDVVTASTRSPNAMAEIVGKAIARALQSLNIPAEYMPPTALGLDGRKISGAATTSYGRSLLHQGTLILRDAVPGMARALGIPISVLASQVTCVAAHCAAPTEANLKAAMADALAASLDRTPILSTLTEIEEQTARREMASLIGTESHALGEDWQYAAGGACE